MKKGINLDVKLINDISGLNFDKESIKIVKKYNKPFVLNHIQGDPNTMQVNPKYKNVLLDVFDYFEEKIKYIRNNKGINTQINVIYQFSKTN